MRDSLTGNVNYVGYAQARYAIVNTETQGIYISNCLKVSADTTGTRIVEGFAELTDESSSPAKGKSLGFLFVEDYFVGLATDGNARASPSHLSLIHI